jgi:hypothetical protein
MAIITTKYTIGWFGTTSSSGDGTGCEPFNLTTNVGRYIMSGGNKNFERGASIADEYTEDDIKGINVFGYTSSGAPQLWSLEKEKAAFYPAFLTDVANQPNRGAIVFTKNAVGDAILACGRMYVIINNNGVEFDVPGFIPSADGVDMGRIDTTLGQ